MPESGTATRAALLVEQLATAIERGQLPPGTLLPTHRALAAQHGVAVATASKVYARLKAMGLVVGETGRGTFVRDRPWQRPWDRDDEARSGADVIDLSFNHPSAPNQTELLRSMLRELASGGDLASLLHQQPPGGRMRERQIVADFLARQRGLSVAAEGVFLVDGIQSGLDVVASAMGETHRTVAVDALTYPGFKMVAEARGLALKAVPASPRGPDLDALDAICRRHRVAAIYAMPTLHNPLGWVLNATQRRRLVTIARRHDCLLIEDAAYAYLAAPAPDALLALAPERTFYLSSLSKSFATGLRFGYVVAPSAWRGRLKSGIRASHWSLSSVVSTMASHWLAEGTMARQESALRDDARRRQSIAHRVFAGMEYVAHPASFFAWLVLPEGMRADRIASALAQRGIAVSKSEAYATTRHAPHALRISLASVAVETLETALKAVRTIIERFPI